MAGVVAMASVIEDFDTQVFINMMMMMMGAIHSMQQLLDFKLFLCCPPDFCTQPESVVAKWGS